MPAQLHYCILLACILCFIGVNAASYSITVNVKYPSANLKSGSKLFLRGNMLSLSWTSGVALSRSSQDHWTYSLRFSDSDINKKLEMKVLIDDSTWMIGANAMFSLAIPESEKATSFQVDIFPWFFTTRGRIEVVTGVVSPQLKNTRNLTLYIPPSYYENQYKTIEQVLVMHDGQNLFDPRTAFMNTAWLCQDTLDPSIYKGDIDEVFVIGVWNTADRMNELTYSYDRSVRDGGKGDLYLDFIEKEVLPLVSERYRINISQANLGIMGSSLGGLISCYAGWTRSSVYGKAGCMSSSFWWNDQDFDTSILVKNPPPSNLKLYVDSGDSGPDQDGMSETIRVANHILRFEPIFRLQVNFFYFLDRGAQHNEIYWGKRFSIPMTSLFPVTTKPLKAL